MRHPDVPWARPKAVSRSMIGHTRRLIATAWLLWDALITAGFIAWFAYAWATATPHQRHEAIVVATTIAAALMTAWSLNEIGRPDPLPDPPPGCYVDEPNGYVKNPDGTPWDPFKPPPAEGTGVVPSVVNPEQEEP